MDKKVLEEAGDSSGHGGKTGELPGVDRGAGLSAGCPGDTEELEEVYSRLERKESVGTPEGTWNWSRSWI